MNRYRNVPGLRGPTRASADTLCQKCLKRGHYSYECKAPAQERPYISRPSRTQQLLNPDLRPKLTTEVPNDLSRTNGVADELLKKKDEERGRKRDIDDLDELSDGRHQSRKRARSLSSHSASSVSTISTNRSRSASRERRQSPEERGRKHEVSSRGRRRDRSRSDSLDKSRIAKGRRSLTPEDLPVPVHERERRPPRPRSPRGRYGGENGRQRREAPAPAPPRERSLSPFSKRLALTQAMNMGR
ncbi:hypothetical protein DTO212C5_521 [Paecilomyces variotii]|nr:hypothetical protein DTO212C5_521 [Paecilomyces variotii]